MLKAIAKLICPSSEKLADKAAKSIQTGYNGIEQSKRDKLAKYIGIANRFAAYAKQLNDLAADGKIDDGERDRIAIALYPMIESAKEIVFE